MQAALLVLAVAATTASASKLGLVVERDVVASDTATGGILAACPGLAVFPLDGTNAGVVAPRIAAYRSVCPSGVVAVELAGLGTTPVDGATVATWWPVWFQQIVTARLGGRVDVIVGPPDPVGTGALDVAAFWAAFAQTIATSGIGALPVIGATPPGMLGVLGTGEAAPASVAPFCETLLAVKSTGVEFGWSSHVLPGVSPPFGADFIYRNLSSYCGVPGTAVFVTRIDPRFGAWQASDLTWLAKLDAELANDTSVRGAALFALGGSTDLTVIAGAIATYLETPVPPSDGGTPGGSGGGGTVGPSPGTTDPLAPSSPKQGCATGGSATLLALLPLGLRRRLRA